MNKLQIILISTALALAAGLYFFGVTIPKKKEGEEQAKAQTLHQQGFDVDHYLQDETKKLPLSGQQFITSLENEVKRGDVKDQQIAVYKQQAAFWRDSVDNPIGYFHFTEMAASLENSEKSLTFAAHSILRYLPYVEHPEEKTWLANQGRELFEKALLIQPSNDSSTVGLGACYIYGASTEGSGPMQGILKIRGVAERDSSNIFAQYMLGIGGVVSGQLDKAVQRFEIVAKAEPDNLEVLFKLAETYENMGDKPNAIKWYSAILAKSNIPQMKKELQQRIELLKK